ncbi:MAG TPA: serine hydrolase domain-containing protein, partial [Roseiflexaceae bacterium]|nr:serine hydrolase domain-containing protein [Roseiflexaceae bacterium]
MHELREFIQDSLARARVPGFAIAIVKGDAVVLADGFGQRDREADLPVTADTLFAIGSCTKAFTTLALGILVERGRIAWEQPVREILPDFRLYDAFAGERLTVRDMVTHRSGLPLHDLVWYGASFTRDELVRRLRYLVPSRDLRQAWQYQNLMYAAAGHLVGVVAGCSWEEFIQREL